MHLSGLDGTLWLLGLLGQVTLLCVLIWRGLYRTFPIVTVFIAYSIVSDPLLYLAHLHVSRDTYFRLFLVDSFSQDLFQLGVLFEVAAAVLSPVKRSLPKGSFAVFAGMLVIGTLLTYFLSGHAKPEQLSVIGDWFLRINFSAAILRLVIFSAIVLFAQMLGIGWRNHVLQLATGFAFYAVVTVVIEMAHHYLGVTNRAQYHALEQARIAGWIFTTGYWSYAMAWKEAPRKEFSPQMANFLVSISGTVRKDKAALIRLNSK